MWSYDRNIWLSSAHIPGKTNYTADFESRNFRQENEWMLDKKSISRCNFTIEFQTLN